MEVCTLCHRYDYTWAVTSLLRSGASLHAGRVLPLVLNAGTVSSVRHAALRTDYDEL